jgi:hypothetical protein
MEDPLLKPLLPALLDFTQARQHTLVTALSETERAAIGTPLHWSARDHVAHLTYWKQRLADTLAALARSETPPSEGDAEVLNPQVFAAQRQRPWEAILREAQRAHTDLLGQLAHVSEADLAGQQPLPRDGADGLTPERQPLWELILSQGFWHPLEHFTQFYLERKEVRQATQLQQTWADRMRQPEVPPEIRSIGLATLGSFYWAIQQRAAAVEPLRQALALNPALAAFFQQVPDLLALLAEEREAKEDRTFEQPPEP